MNPLIDTLLNHRSVRQFTGQAIAPELLNTLLHCGQAAASSSFIQAYSVIRVTNAEHRARIAALAGGQVWIEQSPEFLVFCADLYRINQCCMAQGEGVLQGHTEHFIAATVDVALMAQNVLSAAESLGLGGVFIGGIRNDPETLSELLDLPDLVYPVFGMCLGYPNQETSLKPRLPVTSILHEGKYQTDLIQENIQQYDAQMQSYYQARTRNARTSTWSAQTAKAIQGKLRQHMLSFLQKRGFLRQ